MIAKLLVLVFLVAIVASLFTGGFYLVKDPSASRRTVRALTWRVSLQLALIGFLVLAFFLGWIRPHGVGG